MVEGSEVIETQKLDVLNVKTTLKDIKPTVLICDIDGGEVDLIPDMDLSACALPWSCLSQNQPAPKG